jgi:hypothetical protein
MKEAAGVLFRNQTLVDTKFIWPFVASLAKDLRQDTSTMLRQNIHREIGKAIQRLIVLWEVRTSLSLHQEGEEAKKVLGICPGICPLRNKQIRGASRHRDATEYPESAPTDLKQLLDAEIDDWAYARAYAPGLASFRSSSRAPRPNSLPAMPRRSSF